MAGELEVADGGEAVPAGRPCERCSCAGGVLSCRGPDCDCPAAGAGSASASGLESLLRSHKGPSAPRACCPQCDPAASCRHQELHHVVFRSGERWIYQCQTCECLVGVQGFSPALVSWRPGLTATSVLQYGEVDCWPMECPPTTCARPVLAEGDCCPRCEDQDEDAPCGGQDADGENGTAGGRPCTLAGQLFDSQRGQSGASWAWSDKCAACNCKVSARPSTALRWPRAFSPLSPAASIESEASAPWLPLSQSTSQRGLGLNWRAHSSEIARAKNFLATFFQRK